MKSAKRITRAAGLVLLILAPAPYVLAQQIVTFAAGSFESPSMQATATAGLVISGHMSNSSLHLSSGIASSHSWSVITDSEHDESLPHSFRLHQNYPNPFNPSTTITFDLPESAATRLEVYNAIGRRIAVLIDQEHSAGTHTVSFDASHLSSGVYLYRLSADGNTIDTRTMTLIK